MMRRIREEKHTLVNGLRKHLEQVGNTARQVENEVELTPSICAFSCVVEIYLQLTHERYRPVLAKVKGTRFGEHIFTFNSSSISYTRKSDENIHIARHQFDCHTHPKVNDQTIQV